MSFCLTETLTLLLLLLAKSLRSYFVAGSNAQIIRDSQNGTVPSLLQTVLVTVSALLPDSRLSATSKVFDRSRRAAVIDFIISRRYPWDCLQKSTAVGRTVAPAAAEPHAARGTNRQPTVVAPLETRHLGKKAD
ncbi:hypothetical protein CLCR_05216 [Cladophialophora carrionii]|uniref:Secreted protein n=1 Tax=Cladophialophora carrionii TaxID=86049 RepID=A0A1C1CKW6_9EURO|nr:hypothetical protein CLCR_05216 [Cladophialophora carrionii]